MSKPRVHHDVLIAKVGGSLYDLPELKERLQSWLSERRHTRVVLVPGGGATVDVIRALDRTHQLGEEASHWLALRMVSLNGHFLKALLPEARIVTSPAEETNLGILDAYTFACADEAHPQHLPHLWDATSDSLAVRAAVVARATELVLLKSASWDDEDWQAAARAGVVDRYFPEAIRQTAGLAVRVVNLRTVELPKS